MIQKCKFPKKKDPPICVISFLELTWMVREIVDHFARQLGAGGGGVWGRWSVICGSFWGGGGAVLDPTPRINDPRTTDST